MAGPRGERCSDCIKWDYTDNNFGFCRAGAPRPTIAVASKDGSYTLVWPSTGMEDWCYEFMGAVKDKS